MEEPSARGRLRLACATAFALALVLASPAHSLTITFGNPIPPGGQQAYNSSTYYGEQSFRLTPTAAGMQRNHPVVAGPNWPDNGTIAMSVITNARPILTYELDQTFALRSIDLGEYSAVFARIPVEITLVGTTNLGATIQSTFITDGVIDGLGRNRDFENVRFGSEWSNLRSIQFEHDNPFSMDNIVVEIEAVPEPGSGLLTALGLIGLATGGARTHDRRNR